MRNAEFEVRTQLDELLFQTHSDELGKDLVERLGSFHETAQLRLALLLRVFCGEDLKLQAKD